ncbi:MAG TPA: hypothetical protein VGI81_00225 [Tepidisphaeraceae bacterium]|jgi:hypothetical protein
MTVEELRRLRLANPFRPFDLVIDDGRRLAVKKPYHMAISPVGNAIAVTAGESFELLKPQWVKEAIFRAIEPSGNTPDPSAKSRESV